MILPSSGDYSSFHGVLDPILTSISEANFSKLSLAVQHLHIMNSLIKACHKQFIPTPRISGRCSRSRLPLKIVQLIQVERNLKREISSLKKEVQLAGVILEQGMNGLGSFC